MPDPDEEAICPLEFRYGRSESRELFSRKARLRRWLTVEAALARALSEERVIPRAAAQAIARAARPGVVSQERVDALERETHHDVMALTRALAEKSGVGAPYVHLGATSNDILDSALGLELREAAALLGADLDRLLTELLEQADRHAGTAMVGRTHGQHAVPLTLGYKFATFAAEFLRHKERLRQMVPRLVVGKMSGAVGTGASFGPLAARIEVRTMRLLGLAADPAPTQIVGRDRLAEFAGWIALVATSSDRLSTEIRNLQRTEIAEVSEPFQEGSQVGSSTMAQKRNPVRSENVSSLARFLRALPGPAYENMVQWHERDLANSANERILYSHGVILLDHILNELTGIVADLRVDPARMEANLARTGGAVMAEQVMLALTERGMPRSEAHEVLRKLTRDLRPEDGDTLLSRARHDPVLRTRFSSEELERLVNPTGYVISAHRKTQSVLRELRRRVKGSSGPA